jgi:RNA polymerase sigma factor (sigma-70 family)
MSAGIEVRDHALCYGLPVSDFDPTLALISASDGDQRAWDDIVAHYAGLVLAVARGFRLSEADAADVFQSTWFRLVERLDTIRDGERLGAWLATTARRESINVLRRAGRETPTDDIGVRDVETRTYALPEESLLRTEREHRIWQVFQSLPVRCQNLLRLLLADPPASYEETAAALDMPIGSVGPSRARCLKAMGGMLTAAP